VTKSQESQKLYDRVIAFEALCIIHGILDFPIWISRGKEYLKKEAIDFSKEGITQLPILFREGLENRPADERDEIKRLLSLGWDRRFKEELEKIKEKVDANRSQRNKEEKGIRKETHNTGNQGVLRFEV
jgi:hypothetical protein